MDPKPGPKRDPRFRLFGPAPHRGNRGDPRIGSILGPDSGSNCDPTFGSKIASRPFPSAQVARIAIHPAPALTSRKWTPPKPSGPKKDPPGAAQRKINRKSAPGLPRLGTFLTPESCPRMAPISGPHFFSEFWTPPWTQISVHHSGPRCLHLRSRKPPPPAWPAVSQIWGRALTPVSGPKYPPPNPKVRPPCTFCAFWSRNFAPLNGRPSGVGADRQICNDHIFFRIFVNKIQRGGGKPST